MKNQIYLEKRLKLLLPDRSGSNSKALVASINKNLESLGYILGRKLFNALCSFPKSELENFYKGIIPVLKKMRGAHREFKPMYPNFPEQVIQGSELELYMNAICHYWSFILNDEGVLNDTWLPEYQKEERFPLSEKHKLEVIDLGSEQDFESIFTSLIAANSSISDSDKQIVTWFVESYLDKIVGLLSTQIPQKEQLALVAGLMIKHTNSASCLSKFIKAPTDVLRIAVSLCGGDISLAENTKFKNINRKTRKFLLYLLENCSNLEEDLLKYKNQWIRLGEKLHPGEFSRKYPKVFAAFKKIRNNEKIETFNSQVESGLKEGRIKKTVKLLSDRPGILARRLDHIFRQSPRNRDFTAKEFLSVADKVSTPVLLQVHNHFLKRNSQELRPVFPKGQLAKMQVLDNNLPQIDDEFCANFANDVRDVIISKFKGLNKLGDVFIDEKLKNYPVPFSQRSASKALKTIVRGSQIDLEGNSDTIRFFIWWKNLDNGSRVDIDLSAAILDRDFNHRNDISYYNLRNFCGHHSGDITNAPQGAAEFIDISLKKVIQSGGRYIVMCVNSYTETPLCDLPECFAGYMSRKEPNSGEIFEAKTVKNKFDLAANTKVSLPLIIDCQERKIIWTDIALKNKPIYSNNVSNNKRNIALICKAMVTLKKPNLFNLFEMHAKARGKIIKSPEKADVVFSEDKGITPLHIDKIMSEFMV